MEEEKINLLYELESFIVEKIIKCEKQADKPLGKFNFDIDYFNDFISKELYNKYVKYIYNLINKSNTETFSDISLSCKHFSNETIENSCESIYRSHHIVYFYNVPIPEDGTLEERISFNEILKFTLESYKRYFNRFIEITDLIIKNHISENPEGLNYFLDYYSTSSTENKYKLKTFLSVPELAYLFKLLNEEKLLDIKTNSELHRFISENFQTKKQENISENSIKNKMDNPDSSAIEFWHEKLLHFRQITQKNK